MKLVSLLAMAALAAAALAAPAAAVDMADFTGDGFELRLNSSVTVDGNAIRLGDLFSGDLSRPDKAVAEAPPPGQRIILSADWLADLARTYGLDWRPANAYDRATVYRPGQTITQDEILAAVKADLVAKGMPANYEIEPAHQISPVTVAIDAPRDVFIREGFFNTGTGAFSAVAELPMGPGNARFVPMRGKIFPAVHVPVLKQNAGRNTVITADMLTIVTLPEEQARRETVVDAAYLIGKSPVVFLRAGQPIRDSDVAMVELVDVPVLRDAVNRGAVIAAADLTWRTVDAAGLPADTVLQPEMLVGKSPRRFMAAGAPIRAADVELMRDIEIPVAVRNIPRGDIVAEEDLNWITVNAGDLAARVVTDPGALVGFEARRMIRAGQHFRDFDIARPILVERGKMVTIIMATPLMTLTARGKALEQGGLNQVIRVENSKSGTTVFAEVIDGNTVRLANITQTAMR